MIPYFAVSDITYESRGNAIALGKNDTLFVTGTDSANNIFRQL